MRHVTSRSSFSSFSLTYPNFFPLDFSPHFTFSKAYCLIWAQSNSVLYGQEIVLRKPFRFVISIYTKNVAFPLSYIKSINFRTYFSLFRSSPYKNIILHSNSVFFLSFQSKNISFLKIPRFLSPRGTQTLYMLLTLNANYIPVQISRFPSFQAF